MVKFDDIIEKVGAFGKYQWFLIVMFLSAAIPTSYNTFLPLFVLTVPNHRCALDNYPNDTYAVQSEFHRELINTSIPLEEDKGAIVMSSCYIIRQNVSAIEDEDEAVFGNKSQNGLQKCNKWVYDRTFFDISYIERLNLVCDKKEFRTHSNVAMMVGKLVSAFMQGVLSDRYGRRFTLLLFLTVVVASTFANAFIYNIATLIAFRFLAGLSTTSFYMNAYVITLEFLGPKYRQRFNMTAALTWLSGGFLLTFVAYFIRDSQTLIFALAAPTVPLLSYFFLVPESPRWLMSRGRHEEARVILVKMAKVNKRKFPNELFEKLVLEQLGDKKHINDDDPRNVSANLEDNTNGKVFNLGADVVKDGLKVVTQEAPSQKEQFFFIFKHKSLTIRLLIVLWNWCANSMSYYGMIFNTQNLSGSIYLNFTLTNLVDLAGNLASYYFVDKFGRKKSYIVCYAIASIALLAAIFPSIYGTKEEADLSSLLLIMVGRAGVSTTFNIMYLYVAELFPTTMRNSVLGASSMASRVGSTSAPYIADLGVLFGENMEAALPMAVFGGAGLLATISAFFLPETVNQKLPNNIQEALDIERTQPQTDGERYSEMSPTSSTDIPSQDTESKNNISS